MKLQHEPLGPGRGPQRSARLRTPPGTRGRPRIVRPPRDRPLPYTAPVSHSTELPPAPENTPETTLRTPTPAGWLRLRTVTGTRPEQGPRAPLRLGPHHRSPRPSGRPCHGHFRSAGRPCRRLVAAPRPSLTQSGLATGLRQAGCPRGVESTFLAPNPRPGSTAPWAPGGSFRVPGPAGHPPRCALLEPNTPRTVKPHLPQKLWASRELPTTTPPALSHQGFREQRKGQVRRTHPHACENRPARPGRLQEVKSSLRAQSHTRHTCSGSHPEPTPPPWPKAGALRLPASGVLLSGGACDHSS